ncbi:MAG: 6-bladed beta-propeller [Verrucomicrobiae bacterium]|nr:6-bladed beta-propeller [Verrucomicrobiae bacterium]NNJ42904.1 6-bladed beta-propeller [Akkermansiaceae bacterium]
MKSLLMITFSVAACLTSVHAHDNHNHATHAPVGKGITEVIHTGNGAFSYRTVPGFGKLPDGSKLGPTHGGVVIDQQGLIYVSTNGSKAICVFQPDGTFVKSMTPSVQGIHGMQIITEGEKEYIFGAQLAGAKGQNLRAIKLDLDGNIVLSIPHEGTGEIPGGTKGITGIAVAPDGSIFVSMGYGSNLIHQFDKSGKILKSFGGRGKDPQKFMTCHGLGIDTRFESPRLLVCDREKRRLVHLDLDGNWIGEYATNLRRPCAVSFFGDYCAVAELEARVVILDKNGTPVSFVGDNPNKKQWAGFRVKPEDQKLGIFTAPHGLSFDKEGNLYVQDWNATGRVSKLMLVQPTD